MRIEAIHSEPLPDGQRLRAQLVWEQAANTPFELYLQLNGPWPAGLSAADALLLACAIPALAAGEQRIHSPAACSPLLLIMLPGLLRLSQYWNPRYLGSQALPLLQIPQRSDASQRAAPRARFLSGGVDSLHLLLCNAQPGDYALLVNGFDIGGQPGAADPALFAELCRRSAPLLAKLGVQALHIHTNLRHLDARSGFWGDCFAGFALAAVAHSLAQGLGQVEIASSGEPIGPLVQSPDGLHPYLLYALGSERIGLHVPHLQLGRLDRLRSIVAEPLALAALRVCYFSSSAHYNCGRCEKCVRTALALQLLGQDPAPLFAGLRLEPRSLRDIAIDHPAVAAMYAELLSNMPGASWQPWRNEIEALLTRWAKQQRWLQGQTLGGRWRALRQRWQSAGKRS